MWIGVDFDGTLAEHCDESLGLGAPIPAMVDRVRRWIAAGIEVRIVTARVAACGKFGIDRIDDAGFAEEQRALLTEWCRTHLGSELRITASKDFQMAWLFDDRAVSVQSNTGKICTCIAGVGELRG